MSISAEVPVEAGLRLQLDSSPRCKAKEENIRYDEDEVSVVQWRGWT